MTSLVMIDSGAFTVWKKGTSVDLEEYATFCRGHGDASYYVSLDVIPGGGATHDKERKPSAEERERSCRQGWKNYLALCDLLPREKVIPVYHQFDELRWLEKYLEHGVEYIGISPANSSSRPEKLEWLSSLRRRLFDSAGRPVVKTHGFAVDSLRLMNFWQWHSLDSAWWGLWASYGMIAVPSPLPGGVWDYAKRRFPVKVSVNPKTAVSKKGTGFAIKTVPLPSLPKFARDYLEFCGASLGTSELKTVPQGYKLKTGELWVCKRNRKVLVVIEHGVTNDFVSRAVVNARYPAGAEKQSSVDHVYYAGHFGMRDAVERTIRKRLMTFVDMKTEHARRVLRKHCKRVRRTDAKVET